ncbi:MAG: zinc-binding dehydrogenase [Bdellovibrionales bacterium]|nr:zinc-binding dehydrogenase [Bdellovibrionales bacterium]
MISEFGLRTHVSAEFRLEQIKDAFKCLETGHPIGKVGLKLI